MGNATEIKPALFHCWEHSVYPMLDMETGETRYHAYVMAIVENPAGKLEKHRPSDIEFSDTGRVIDRIRESIARNIDNDSEGVRNDR